MVDIQFKMWYNTIEHVAQTNTQRHSLGKAI